MMHAGLRADTGANMAKVTITEAAKLAGVSRVTMYRKYIKTGSISVEKDRDGKPQIDTSELIRVVGEIQCVTLSNASETLDKRDDTTVNDGVLRAELGACMGMLAAKEEELRLAREEIAWLRARIESAEQKLLTGPNTRRRWWWPW